MGDGRWAYLVDGRHRNAMVNQALIELVRCDKTRLGEARDTNFLVGAITAHGLLQGALKRLAEAKN